MRFPIQEVLCKIKIKIKINLKNASSPSGVVKISLEFNDHYCILQKIKILLHENFFS